MTITNGYVTLNDFKERIDLDDHLDDDKLDTIITAASRLVDDVCGRRFYAATETRYYTPDNGVYLRVDDLLTVTTLKTDEDGDRTYEVTWATTDYDLMPLNATLDGWPFMSIEITPDGDNSFPTVAKGVEIAGSFGFASTTPPAIQEACVLAAHRLLKRADTPLGVSAAAALGQMQVMIRELGSDPDFMLLVSSYIKGW